MVSQKNCLLSVFASSMSRVITTCPHGNLPFVFFNSYAYICTCISRHLKETILSSITWSEMGKQNIQAKEVY